MFKENFEDVLTAKQLKPLLWIDELNDPFYLLNIGEVYRLVKIVAKIQSAVNLLGEKTSPYCSKRGDFLR